MLDSKFKIVFLIGFLVGSVIRRLGTRRYRRGQARKERKLLLDTLLVWFAATGLLVVPLLYLFTAWLDFANYGLPTWAGWLGAPVFTAALWLLWKSHADLALNWSPTLEIREEHTLVTGGVYRHIRHPMYAAHWLWGIAQVLLLQNWIAGPALLAVFVPLCLVRVPREEQMMLERFGEEYRQYMNRTGRMLPRLRR